MNMTMAFPWSGELGPLALMETGVAMEGYGVAIALLLPITAGMVLTQVNPYHALVIRGILGAMAALVYALFGAADVALTEALVGTMLSITLYAIAVRSSLSLRLGILAPTAENPPSQWAHLLNVVRGAIRPYHMRLELVPYTTPQALEAALQTKDIHALCWESPQPEAAMTYRIHVRGERLYQLLGGAVPPALAHLHLLPLEGRAAPEPPSPQPEPSPEMPSPGGQSL